MRPAIASEYLKEGTDLFKALTLLQKDNTSHLRFCEAKPIEAEVRW